MYTDPHVTAQPQGQGRIAVLPPDWLWGYLAAHAPEAAAAACKAVDLQTAAAYFKVVLCLISAFLSAFACGSICHLANILNFASAVCAWSLEVNGMCICIASTGYGSCHE